MRFDRYGVFNLAIAVSARMTGVSPEKLELYKPFDDGSGVLKWRCLGDPSVVINFEQINDDYCDCPDGSDEIGTNACPYNASNKFYCANVGHIPGYIENFKLNDGVCDYDICCDGSDEYLTGDCPDKCAEVNSQYVEYRDMVMKEAKVADDIKKEMIKSAKSVKEQAKTKLDETILKKAQLEQEIQEIENKIKRVSSASNEVLVYDKISSHIKNIMVKFDQLAVKQSSTNGNLERLETILSKLTSGYNPNFNDAAVKAAVNEFQNYVSNKREDSKDLDLTNNVEELKEYSKTIKLGSDSEANVPTVSNMVHYYVTKLFRLLASEDFEQNVMEPSQKLELLESLEVKLKTIKKSLESTNKMFELLQSNLELDFGEDDILRGVAGKTITSTIGGYEYKVGFLTNVYQDTNLLGTYSHHEDGKLYYINGNRCWNGPLRLAVVDIQCGMENTIVSLSEPEKCEYYIVVTSPVGCKDVNEETIQQSFKVDYAKL